MKARPRTLVIALLLGAISSGAGALFFLIPRDEVPFFHRVSDLAVHFGALSHTSVLALPAPEYETTPNPDLAVIAIDELSIGNAKAGLGSFPFPRSVYGTVLAHLRAAGVKTVVFDIDFLEPSAEPAQDRAFAAGLKTIPSVLAYTIATTSGGNLGVTPPAATLAPFAAATGFNTIDAPGGTLIGQPMRITTGATGERANQTFVALAAAGAAAFTGHAIDASLPTLDGRFLLVAPKLDARVDRNARNADVEVQSLGFAGRGVIPFATAYAGTPSDLAALRGAIVFIGPTAQALGDFVQTARTANTPGVFVNARLADQLIRHIALAPAPLWLDIALIVALPLLAALALTLMRTPVAIASCLLGTLVYAYANLYAFVEQLYWIDLIHVVFATALATLLVALYRVLHESGQRRVVTALFGTHVSHAVVDEILKQEHPTSALALRGKRVKATIFYSDIRGFTAMSETMSPEEIYAQLNEYFETMCAIIFRHGGYVDKFIGDCIMAVFSAPYQRPDDARSAVLAAIEQQRAIDELCERWRAEGKREFTVGMGINTGEVVMGNLGARARMNYTVIGDNVNVAARLYNVAKGGEIIISDATYAEVADVALAEERGTIAVKGKAQPIRIFNLTGVR